jgi:hypothetical protein
MGITMEDGSWLLEKLCFGSQTFLLYTTQTRQWVSRLGTDCWSQSYNT